MDEFDVRELLAIARKIRPHAGFFEWPDRATKEIGVVTSLLDGLPAENPLSAVVQVRPGRPDPPDVIGTLEDGNLVAIEVTELVDEDVTAHNVRAARETEGQDVLERMKRRLLRVWDAPGLIKALDEALREKDGKALHGGPFDRYVVVLHTDEDMLDHEEAGEWLRDHQFRGLQQTADAYLLFSYVPAVGGCPNIRLDVGR